MFDAMNFLNLGFFECFKRLLILKVNCLLFKIGRQPSMQFFVNISNTALKLRKTGLQSFGNIFVSGHSPPLTLFLKTRIEPRSDSQKAASHLQSIRDGASAGSDHR